jgi:hypothetical protein
MARIDNIIAAVVDPINAMGEPCRFSQPICAAHATTAGAVNERKPATIPIPMAKTRRWFTNYSSLTATSISRKSDM